MARATVSVTIDNEREVMAVNAWLNRWGPRIQLSDQQGCGCCVDIWDVEGPADLIASIPPASLADSKWVKSDAPSEEKPV